MRQRASRSSPCWAPAIAITLAPLAPKRSAIAPRKRPRPSVGPWPHAARASRASTRVTASRNASVGKWSSAGSPAASDTIAGSAACRTRSRTVESTDLERRRGHLAPPGERRGGRVGPGRHERAAPDVAADQAARLELAEGAHDGGATDGERGGEVALGRQPEPRRQAAARDPALERLHQAAVHRTRARHRRRIRADRAKQANRRLALFESSLSHDPQILLRRSDGAKRFTWTGGSCRRPKRR